MLNFHLLQYSILNFEFFTCNNIPLNYEILEKDST